MQTTWIVAADSSRVRIFEELDAEHHLQEVQDFANPAGHAQEQELLTGKPYRRNMSKGDLGGTHDGQPETDPVEHENIKFSKDVDAYLDKARNEHRFDRLRVIAAPHFLGLLRQNLSKETQKLVEEEIDKDISWFDKNEIEKFVQNLHH